MFGMILLGVVVLILAVTVGISILRSFAKTTFRFLTVLISGIAALVTCLIMKNNLPTPAEFLQDSNGLATMGGPIGELVQKLMEFGEISPTLIELVIQLIGALAFPLICLVLFCLYAFLTWVIYLIVSRILKLPLKGLNALVPLPRVWGGVLGLLQGVVIVMVLLIPISGYVAIAQPTVDGLVEQEILDPNDATIQSVQDVVVEMNASPVLSVYRTVGGQMLTDSMMDMEVAGMDVKLEEELNPVLGLVANISELGKTEFANYSTKEAELIRALGTSFEDSKLLAPIVGDILYAATDAWMNGEAFLGVEKPDLGEATELMGPFVDALLEVLHNDAKTAELLQADINTLADVIATLVQHGVIANLNNTEELVAALGGEGVVNSLITTLGANESTKCLIPEVTNLGIRAIGQVLKVPQDVESVYGDFMDDIAGALNDVSSLSEAEQVEVLSERIDAAFDEAGVPIDDEIVDFYSASLVHDLIENNPNGEITSADVQAFFQIYAENAGEVASDSVSSSTNRPSFDLLNNTNPYAGTIYENMTAEQRAKTATATLANLCTQLSKMDGNAENFAEEAKTLVTDTFTNLLGEGHATLTVIENTEITKPVSQESIQNTSSMKSSDDLKETTTVVTMNDLLIDTKAAAENMDSAAVSKEAESIEAIFSTAGSLLGSLGGNTSELNITDVASSMGTILDSLQQTGSFGEEKTASLFTAVMQSNTVRESVGLDMKTATEMANKATEGNSNYSKTMSTVAGSVTLVDQMKNGKEVSNDELVKLIRDLTPQTAAMLKIFMTGDRMVSFGVPAKNAGMTAELVSSVFTYMSREDLADYDAEARGLNSVLQIAMSAKNSDNKQLFTTSEGPGRLPSASSIVSDMMGSDAIMFALKDVLTNGSSVTNSDPFGFAEKLEKDPASKASLESAIASHRSSHPGIDSLSYEALEAALGLR